MLSEGDDGEEPDKTWYYIGGGLGALLLVLIIVVVALCTSSRSTKGADTIPDYMRATVNNQAYVRRFPRMHQSNVS